MALEEVVLCRRNAAGFRAFPKQICKLKNSDRADDDVKNRILKMPRPSVVENSVENKVPSKWIAKKIKARMRISKP